MSNVASGVPREDPLPVQSTYFSASSLGPCGVCVGGGPQAHTRGWEGNGEPHSTGSKRKTMFVRAAQLGFSLKDVRFCINSCTQTCFALLYSRL